jgi:hypothetical protein
MFSKISIRLFLFIYIKKYRFQLLPNFTKENVLVPYLYKYIRMYDKVPRLEHSLLTIYREFENYALLKLKEKSYRYVTHCTLIKTIHVFNLKF